MVILGMDVKMIRQWGLIGFAVVWGGMILGGDVSLVSELLEQSLQIETIRCDIRREADIDGRRTTTLSRVWFQRPDRLRVETVMPFSRCIVVDGTTIYKWVDGEAEGAQISLSDAPEEELRQVRRTPGTMDEHLMRLQSAREIKLTHSSAYPVRRGYETGSPHPYAILSLDKKGRLAVLEFLDREDRETLFLRTELSGWMEPVPGVRIAGLQRTTASGRDGSSMQETVRVSGVRVNEPMDAVLFQRPDGDTGITFLTPAEMEINLHDRP